MFNLEKSLSMYAKDMKFAKNARYAKQKYVKLGLLIAVLVWSVFIPVRDAQGIGMEDVTVTSTIDDPTGVQTAIVYSAERGETLRDLAGLLNFDPELVAAMNNMQPGDSLKQGQVIVFPAEATITHVVQAGDTVWELARTYGTEIEKIISDNDLTDANLLLVGQELSIPAPRLASVFAASGNIRSRGDDGTFKVMSGESGTGETGNADTGKLSQLQWPVEGPVSSVFGWRDDRMHEGLDIVAPEGDNIRAALPGRVVFAGDRGTYGNAVILRHGDGIRTLYAHASRLLVEEGTWVGQGDPIAEVGSTGHSTGPHLHFEVLLNGTPLDPEKYLPYN